MRERDIIIPEGLHFKSSRIMPNGGVIYEMNSAESARWLRRITTAEMFAATMGGENVTVRERSYPVFVEFVPIHCDLTDPYALIEYANASNIESGALTSAKWIKPEARRTERQTVAHAIFKFNCPRAANHAI
ncbi:uncharacterized protein B0H18DRAFT_882023, partial [Fomitopsis serialis]|uniref:uncharacterized protein n=1 Tax=Fomitopsis serialis TaxID=139415 RepID=UPI002007D608